MTTRYAKIVKKTHNHSREMQRDYKDTESYHKEVA